MSNPRLFAQPTQYDVTYLTTSNTKKGQHKAILILRNRDPEAKLKEIHFYGFNENFLLNKYNPCHSMQMQLHFSSIEEREKFYRDACSDQAKLFINVANESKSTDNAAKAGLFLHDLWINNRDMTKHMLYCVDQFAGLDKAARKIISRYLNIGILSPTIALNTDIIANDKLVSFREELREIKYQSSSLVANQSLLASNNNEPGEKPEKEIISEDSPLLTIKPS